MELNYRQNLGGYSSVRNIQINILVVDDDPISLNVITKHLQAMNYHVVATTNPIEALSILRREHETFDIVLSDVHMPQMSGLDLLSHVVEEYQLPIVLMSVDCNKNIMLKGLESGASFYIVKPITEESLKKLWQFAISGRKSTSIEKPSNIITSVSPNTNKYGQITLKRSNEDANHGFNGKINKKPKLIWTTSLHNLFLEAVNKIGIEKAVPKKILELMNVPGLRRENVASHLQKYRIFLKRISELSDPSENGFLYNSNERPLRSSFILNEITYLANNLQQQYRELLKGSRKTHKNSSEDTNSKYKKISDSISDDNNSNNPNSIRVNCIGNVQSTMNNNNYVGLRINTNGEMIMNNHHMGDQLRHVDVAFHFDTNKGTTFGNDFEFGSFDSPDYGVEAFEGFDKGVFINDDISFERYYSEDVN